MNVLILGGTGWLGGEIAAAHVRAGATVTCLARGVSGEAPRGAELLTVDRTDDDAYDEVATRDWDEIVELSWGPRLVGSALDALAARARHWTLVSSISVYRPPFAPGADESAPVVEPVDLDDYGHAKVAAERATADRIPADRLLVARAGLIVGPGDRSDRFGYWPARFALAGSDPVLVPDATEHWAQGIDVRDLAAWVAQAPTAGVTGLVDAVGESRPLVEVLDAAAAAAGHRGEHVVAAPDRLADLGVAPWAGPRSLPLWLPADLAGMTRRSGDRYRATGGALRPLEETLADTLADERERGLGRERRSGLSRAEELAVLAAL